MKYLVLLTTVFFWGHAWAVSECMGRTANGHWVSVQVETTGARGIPARGEVIIEKDENKFGYRFNHEDITQFFEYDETASNTAMVGLAAYVDKEFPVAIKYTGPNFVDMDLKSVLSEGTTGVTKGNFLRVWKGPGHMAADQFQLTNVVCSTWPNI